MKNSLVLLLAGVCVLTVLGSAASAQSPASDSDRNHHDGLMLRLTAGAAYSSTGVFGRDGHMFDDTPARLKGPAMDFDLALGGVLLTNFAIHANVQYWHAFNPDVHIDAGGLGSGSISTDDTSLGGLHVGGGATVWLGESNVYASASIGATMLRARVGDTVDESSRWGLGGQALLGKEWWVSNNFGIGLAAAFGWHIIPTNSDDISYRGFNAGGRLSFTLN